MLTRRSPQRRSNRVLRGLRFLRRLRRAPALRVRGCSGNGRGIPFALGGYGMVTAVRMALTARAFFFDVDNLSRAAYVTVTPNDAPTR
jgi:hypothetical protein